MVSITKIKRYWRATTLLFLMLNLNLYAQTNNVLELHAVNLGNIKLDGVKGREEWNMATKFLVTKNFSLYIAADSLWIYIAVFSSEPASHYTDLYVLNSITLNLHSSMQIGERILPDNKSWTDEMPEWSWGNNKNWHANRVQFKSDASDTLPFEQQVLDYDGQEFKVSLSKVSKTFKMMILVRDFADEKFQISYRVQADRHNPISWLEIQLD